MRGSSLHPLLALQKAARGISPGAGSRSDSPSSLGQTRSSQWLLGRWPAQRERLGGRETWLRRIFYSVSYPPQSPRDTRKVHPQSEQCKGNSQSMPPTSHTRSKNKPPLPRPSTLRLMTSLRACIDLRTAAVYGNAALKYSIRGDDKRSSGS